MYPGHAACISMSFWIVRRFDSNAAGFTSDTTERLPFNALQVRLQSSSLACVHGQVYIFEVARDASRSAADQLVDRKHADPRGDYELSFLRSAPGIIWAILPISCRWRRPALCPRSLAKSVVGAGVSILVFIPGTPVPYTVSTSRKS